MPENSKLQELQPIKDYMTLCSSSWGELGNSLNSNSLHPWGDTICGAQWTMQSSLQERILQVSRDEGCRAGTGAVGMLIVEEKAGQTQGLTFLSKSKLRAGSN